MTDVSPDVTQYVDLRIYDRQPTALLQRAITNAAIVLPTWVPAEANTEMVILEGQALESAEEVFAINRLPGAMTSILLQLFNINQLPGSPPTATVTFSLVDTLGHTIPSGTNLQIPAAVTGNGDVYFTTNAPATAAPGSATTGAVGITGTTNTDAANAIASGTAVNILDSIYLANGCTLATAVTGGALPETAFAFLSRGITVLQSLNSTLVQPQQFVNYALANGAFRAYVEDDYDATVPGGAEGVISLAILGENAAVFTDDQLTAMSQAMNALTQANLVIRVVTPTITDVNVTAAVMAVSGQDPSTLQASVVAALQAYLNTNTWDWEAAVHTDKLTAITDAVAGVDYTVSLTVPAVDVELTGFAPLAAAGTITVNVLTSALTTTLAAAITSTTATSLTVTADTSFPTGAEYVIQVDSEQMLVTAGQGTTGWTVTRGYNSTTKATHLDGATVTLL